MGGKVMIIPHEKMPTKQGLPVLSIKNRVNNDSSNY
jgi:hypothetical protein